MLRPARQLNNLHRITTPTAPGICKIYYIPVEAVASDPIVNTTEGVVSALPTLVADWNVAIGDSHSQEYTESQTDTDAGPIFDIAVEFIIPSEAKHNHILLHNILHHRYIVVVVSRTGLIKWIGTKDNPVLCQQSTKSGKRNDGNSTLSNLKFVWRSPSKPLLLNPSIVFEVMG